MEDPEVRYRSIVGLEIWIFQIRFIKAITADIEQTHQKECRCMSGRGPQLPWGIWEEWMIAQDTESLSVNEIKKDTAESYVLKDDFPLIRLNSLVATRFDILWIYWCDHTCALQSGLGGTSIWISNCESGICLWVYVSFSRHSSTSLASWQRQGIHKVDTYAMQDVPSCFLLIPLSLCSSPPTFSYGSCQATSMNSIKG